MRGRNGDPMRIKLHWRQPCRERVAQAAYFLPSFSALFFDFVFFFSRCKTSSSLFFWVSYLNLVWYKKVQSMETTTIKNTSSYFIKIYYIIQEEINKIVQRELQLGDRATAAVGGESLSLSFMNQTFALIYILIYILFVLVCTCNIEFA